METTVEKEVERDLITKLRHRNRLAHRTIFELKDRLKEVLLDQKVSVRRAAMHATKVLRLREAIRGLRRGLYRAKRRAERAECEVAVWRRFATDRERERVNGVMEEFGRGECSWRPSTKR